MTEYAKLVLAEQTCHTIEIRERATGKDIPTRQIPWVICWDVTDILQRQ